MTGMNFAHVMVLAALVGSIVLMVQSSARLFPVIALLASGAETLLVYRVIHFSMRGIDIGLILGAALVVSGVVAWWQQSQKPAVTAATVVALVGALQVLSRYA